MSTHIQKSTRKIQSSTISRTVIMNQKIRHTQSKRCIQWGSSFRLNDTNLLLNDVTSIGGSIHLERRWRSGACYIVQLLTQETAVGNFQFSNICTFISSLFFHLFTLYLSSLLYDWNMLVRAVWTLTIVLFCFNLCSNDCTVRHLVGLSHDAPTRGVLESMAETKGSNRQNKETCSFLPRLSAPSFMSPRFFFPSALIYVAPASLATQRGSELVSLSPHFCNNS